MIFSVGAGPGFPSPPPDDREPGEAILYADRVERDEARGLVMAIGSAEITHGDTYISADYIEFNEITKDITAIGGVIMEDPKDRIFAHSMEYNGKTKVGVLYNADGILTHTFYFKGERVERLDEDRYRIFDGRITACAGDDPSWAFNSGEAYVPLGGMAHFKNPSFRMGGIPTIYSPYFAYPVKRERSTGFLIPSMGASSRDGFSVDNAFFWAINPSQDMTLGLDYLANRGYRPNLEYRYMLSRGAGQLNSSYLKDRSIGVNFYNLEYHHGQLLPHDIIAAVNVDMESESSISREFEWDVNRRTRKYTDSSFIMAKSFEDLSIQMETRLFNNLERGVDEVFGTLPTISVSNSRERIRNTPLFFDLESSYVNFLEEKGRSRRTLQRVDMAPRVTLPLNRYPFLTVTPSFTLRETYYSKTSGDGDGFGREMVEATTVIGGLNAYNVYDLNIGRISKIKHLVEPVVFHVYRDFLFSEDVASSREIMRFDGIDGLDRANAVVYGIINRFLAQEMGSDGNLSVREIARVSVSQSYDIREAGRDGPNRRPFSDVSLDIETRLLPSLIFNFDGGYDLNEGMFQTSNYEVGVISKRFTMQLDRRLNRRENEEFISAGVSLAFLKGWRVEYETRYDVAADLFSQNSVGLNYTSGCWSFRGDFVDREAETAFFFTFTLKELGTIGRRFGLRVQPSS